MPDPGSHAFDVQRTRRRAEYDDTGTPDENADRAARDELEREHPPVPKGDPDRAAGPRGDGQGGAAVEKSPATGPALRSPAFTDHTLIPDRYHDTDDTDDAVPPPLEWSEVPEDAAELALVVEDLDADGRVHRLVVGIPSSSTGLGEDGLPDGAAEGRTGGGRIGWDPPHPPVGEEHRYAFRLLVLDTPLGLSEGATPEDLHAAAEGHEVCRGTLVGLVAR
jgi:Raf kinase inhibitor-like YbhB/YbcL family protein